MKINYKIVTLILAGVLIVTYAWHWEAIFSHRYDMGKMDMSGMHMQNNSGMHQMPNGQMMMMNNGSEMNMGDMTMNQMVNDMQGKTGRDLEKAFITGMIPHHQGAVDMAKLLLQDKTISTELKTFAENIIKAQDSEIKMMNEWLKKY